MKQLKTLVAACALGFTALSGSAWGALCDSSSLSLDGFTGTCQQYSGGATATFDRLLVLDIPVPGSEWQRLGASDGDTSEGGFAFGMDWSLNIGTGVSGNWTLTGDGALQDTPIDILAFILLDTGSGPTRDEYLSFYISGATWSDVDSELSGRYSFSDGTEPVQSKGIFVYGLQRSGDPGNGGGQLPEPGTFVLLAGLALAGFGARAIGRRA